MLWLALTVGSTGYFSASSVTMATFVVPEESTSARKYSRVFTTDVFWGEGEPASVTSPVGVMSTRPTPASKVSAADASHCRPAMARTSRVMRDG